MILQFFKNELHTLSERCSWLRAWKFWTGTADTNQHLPRNVTSVPAFLEQNWFSWTLCPLSRFFFIQSNELKIQILWETFWWNFCITHWQTENSSLSANLNRCTLPCLCTVAFATTVALFCFSSNRTVYKCTKLLLAAKTSLGLLSQTGKPNV